MAWALVRVGWRGVVAGAGRDGTLRASWCCSSSEGAMYSSTLNSMRELNRSTPLENHNGKMLSPTPTAFFPVPFGVTRDQTTAPFDVPRRHWHVSLTPLARHGNVPCAAPLRPHAAGELGSKDVGLFQPIRKWMGPGAGTEARAG